MPHETVRDVMEIAIKSHQSMHDSGAISAHDLEFSTKLAQLIQQYYGDHPVPYGIRGALVLVGDHATMAGRLSAFRDMAILTPEELEKKQHANRAMRQQALAELQALTEEVQPKDPKDLN